ncbi:MAG TPA: gamma-glutamyl-gamma-aminobutyrate hydrolase family protein [Candidatus Limnocylindria bacterium]
MSRPVALTLCGHDRPRCRWARDLYLRGLTDEGLAVVAVEPGDALPQDLGGLCLSGGEDVAPERYGAVPDGSEPPFVERDGTEFALFAQARARAIPILAICRGFQLVNVALGGSLVQHRAGHSEEHGPLVPHLVTAAPDSLLARASGTAPHRVNSYHHQAVTDATLAPGLRATARVDGLIEAFEEVDAATRPWLLGVQWHPERHDLAPEAKGVFQAFAAAVRAAAPVHEPAPAAAR